MKSFAAWCALVPACVLLLTACGSTEDDCRSGIADMSRKVTAMIGSVELAPAVPPIQDELDAAKARRDAGDFAGCIESVGRARAELNRSQRTNQ